ncbi:MAG: NUDIX hydrolase N-terminal domain-containing protein [Actinobacteria bacterium]|nr:NUDIX hydrolase N-terminal domain-containing protein [Actinomycetota bacterium]MCL6104878.1 NUDIX hydrolase N-terminal domain-containing protein [Actinomycetota bacterium]
MPSHSDSTDDNHYNLVSQQDLCRWGESLAGVARTGLGFTKSLYERERFEEIIKIAAEIKASSRAAGEMRDSTNNVDNKVNAPDAKAFAQEWIDDIQDGVSGYVTPKVAIGAVVGNEHQEMLLIKRADSGIWLYPTGWADIGYSPAEVVIKEVKEETGIDVKPVRLIAVFDGLRLGITRMPFYSLIFQCKLLGGDLKPHPLECQDVGWFSRDKLPMPLGRAETWTKHFFAAIAGEPVEVMFDEPRDPVWKNT